MKKELTPVATQPSSPGGVVDARGVAPWKPGEREAALSGSQSPRTRPKTTEPPVPALQTAPSENRVLAIIAKLDCANVLDALATTAPVARIFGAVNQETASCVQEFGKGALCSVQESAKQWE